MGDFTQKMGLATWDQPLDRYDYLQLSNNWQILDFHDHSPGRGVQVGTSGLAVGAVQGSNIALGGVTGNKLAAGTVTGDKTDPSLTGRRKVGQAIGFISGVLTASVIYGFAADGTTFVGGSPGIAKGMYFWRLDPSLFSVVGRTTNLIMRTSYLVATAPGTTLNFELDYVTGATPQTGVNYYPNNGGPLAASTASVTLSTNNTTGAIETTPFLFPALASFYPVVYASANTATNTSVSVMIQLFVVNT